MVDKARRRIVAALALALTATGAQGVQTAPQAGAHALTASVNPWGTRPVRTQATQNSGVTAAARKMQTGSVTVTVGLYPSGLDAAGNYLYVANGGSNSVSVIDQRTRTVVATLTDPSFSSPFNVATARDGRHVYVTNANGHSVSLIDADHNTVSTITDPSFDGTAGVAVARTSGLVYVTNLNNNVLGVIDDRNGQRVTTLTDPSLNVPEDVTVDQRRQLVFVVNRGGNSVSVYNERTRTFSVITNAACTDPGGVCFNNPTSVADDARRNRLYVTNPRVNTITVVDLTTGKAHNIVNAGFDYPFIVRVDPARGIAYVTNNNAAVMGNVDNGNGVAAISEATDAVSFINDPSFDGPEFLYINRPTGELVVTDDNANYVTYVQGAGHQ